MGRHTTLVQRQAFYELHQQGLSYPKIAEQHQVSPECVRYWCRRQRDGGSCQSRYSREATGILSRFHWLVRYCVLRLRLEHPRWGPESIRSNMEDRDSLDGIKLPSATQIGRYLHQWPRFRRQPKTEDSEPRPHLPTHVHQRWQIDFKVNIELEDGTAVDMHTVCDQVGKVCIHAALHRTEQVNIRSKRVPMEDARSTLRQSFARWGTLPEEIQTDGESTLVVTKADAFPSKFTLWLKGLGIKHIVIRNVLENAEVERGHRTMNDYAIVGNERCSIVELQSILDKAVQDKAFKLPCRAKGCDGRPPVQAHPELLDPERTFRPEHELALFDLRRVDAFLSTFTWRRKVGKTGQIRLGGHERRYSVGRAYARQNVWVRFDPRDRSFVFYMPTDDDVSTEQVLEEIGRTPAQGLEIDELTGISNPAEDLGPQQLPLPYCSRGVNC